jgi:hypothetical protein
MLKVCKSVEKLMQKTWSANILPGVPETIIKIDAEIFELEQKLKDCLAIEKHAVLTARLEELKKRRQAHLERIEKQARDKIK